jgi:hypothetical protein
MSLCCEKLFQAFAFSNQLVSLRRGIRGGVFAGEIPPGRDNLRPDAGAEERPGGAILPIRSVPQRRGGAIQVLSQFTHSVKAPGFHP